MQDGSIHIGEMGGGKDRVGPEEVMTASGGCTESENSLNGK